MSCCCSVTKSCLTLCNPMSCSMPGFPVHHQHPELAQTHLYWVTDAIQPFHPLLSPFPPGMRGFSSESGFRNRWPKYWSFSFSISPSNVYPRLHFFFFERPVIFYLLKMNSFRSKGNFSKKHQKVQCKASPH